MTAPGDDREDASDGSAGSDASNPADPVDEVSPDATVTAPSHNPEEPAELEPVSDTGESAQFDERESQRPPHLGSGEDSHSGDSEQTGDSWQLFTRDLLMSVLAVALLGMYLFAVSGVWPPMVAIESESMEPNMNVNDLVFLMDTDRFQPSDAYGETGVVSAKTGDETGYEKYGDSGDVIVFEPDGNEDTTPIIHRAMFWVDEGENWCEMADRADDSTSLGSLNTEDDRCIAPNEGFITKGDNNHQYDQASSTQANKPVKPEWIIGTAEVRIPRLGWFRLQFV